MGIILELTFTHDTIHKDCIINRSWVLNIKCSAAIKSRGQKFS